MKKPDGLLNTQNWERIPNPKYCAMREAPPTVKITKEICLEIAILDKSKNFQAKKMSQANTNEAAPLGAKPHLSSHTVANIDHPVSAQKNHIPGKSKLAIRRSK